MNILIVGAGKIGKNLAEDMTRKGHYVVVVEKNENVCGQIKTTDNLKVICGDGCDMIVLENASIKTADVVAAVTGDDEDNLVVAQLSKLQPNRPRVVSIINHPRNEWLFNKGWGIDAAESPITLISRLIEQDIDQEKAV
jgi:trk system potassium uptake protein TrkA